MSITDNYEINVAKDGKHYCKIELPDRLEELAMKKFIELKKLFGDNYDLSMTYWECRGYDIKEKKVS